MQTAVSKRRRSKPRVVMSTQEIRRTLGAMLLKEKLVTTIDLHAVLQKMISDNYTKPLFFWLCELQIVDENRILNCIRRCQPDVPIGALLLEFQYVEPENLERAVVMQEEENFKRKLGQILLESNWVKPNNLAKSLAAQLGFEFINPTVEQINPELMAKAGIDICRRCGFIPVVQREGNIVVAFTDPMDQEARTTAARALNSVITPVMCAASYIEKQLDLQGRAVEPTAVESGQEKSTDLFDVIEAAIQDCASDIHIEPVNSSSRIRLRIDGLLRTERDITHEQRQAMIARLKNLAELDNAEHGRHQSGQFAHTSINSHHPVRIKCSFFVTEEGVSAVMRVNTRRDDLMGLSMLGMHESVLDQFKEQALEDPNGSIILSGPSGSGKTTTLYSCIDHLNKEQSSIVCVEDHIEYAIDGVKQCFVNRRPGGSYAESIGHMLKQDPDVLVVGEIHGQGVAKTATKVMLGGHKVLTTFCSDDGIGVLLRMKNIDSELFAVSPAVKAMISQRLVRRVCHNCARAYEPTAAEQERYGLALEDLAIATFTKGKGCSSCGGSGYNGRIGVYEVLIIDEALREAVLMGKTSAQIRQLGVEQSGLITLVEDGILKAASGSTSLHELNRVLPRSSEPRSLSLLRTLGY